MKKQIGILTWHYYPNFGSALQAYALQKTLIAIGAKAQIINYRNPKFGVANPLKDNIRFLLSKLSVFFPLKLKKRFSYKYLNFHKSCLSQSKTIYDKDKLLSLCDKYDTIVCGSDQIWAPNVFNPVYMADFADGKKINKISYAASIGLNDIPDDFAVLYKELLSDFKAVSVREHQGKELLEKRCGIDSSVVLDPTLLLDLSEYQKIECPDKKVKKPFVFCYFLNANHKYRKLVEDYAKSNGLEIYGFCANKSDYFWLNSAEKAGPREFLWYIHNAHTIFTDSYHGSIFSLLYHKNFYTFERFDDNDPICQNSRIYQLANYFSIYDRIISQNSDISECKPIDYNNFEKNLNNLKTSSFEFLQEALK